MQPRDPQGPRGGGDRDVTPLQLGMSFLDFLAKRIAAGLRETFAPQPVAPEPAKRKLGRRGRGRPG